MKPSQSTPKSRAAIYRTAAQKCEKDKTLESCMAVEFSTGRDITSDGWAAETVAYRETLLPPGVGNYWTMTFDCGVDLNEVQNIRVLALCFMAAMTEAHDA